MTLRSLPGLGAPRIQNLRPIQWIETLALIVCSLTSQLKMFDGDATNMLRPSDRRNAQNRRRRGGHRSFELLMGCIVWIKRYTQDLSMLHKITSVPLGPCLVPLVTLENVKTTAQSCVPTRVNAHDTKCASQVLKMM